MQIFFFLVFCFFFLYSISLAIKILRKVFFFLCIAWAIAVKATWCVSSMWICSMVVGLKQGHKHSNTCLVALAGPWRAVHMQQCPPSFGGVTLSVGWMTCSAPQGGVFLPASLVLQLVCWNLLLRQSLYLKAFVEVTFSHWKGVNWFYKGSWI